MRYFNSRSRLALACVLALGAAAVSLPAAAQGGPKRGAAVAEFQVDGIVVKLKAGMVGENIAAMRLEAKNLRAAERAAIAAVAGHLGGQVKLERRLEGDSVYRLALHKKMSTKEAQALVDAIAAMPGVEFAEVETRATLDQAAPNDTFFNLQWGLMSPQRSPDANLGAARAVDAWGVMDSPLWTPYQQRLPVVVAFIDSGLRFGHSDFNGRVSGGLGYDFVSAETAAAGNNDGNGRDGVATDPGTWAAAGTCGTSSAAVNSNWHGTGVASLIAGRTNDSNGIAGAVGADGNISLLGVRAYGSCGGTVTDIADSVRWTAGGTVTNAPVNHTPAAVLNLSLSGPGSCPAYLQAAIDDARSRGASVVAAAGNTGETGVSRWPSNCNGVIGVGAHNRAGDATDYATVSSAVALTAPGGVVASGDGIAMASNNGTTTPTTSGWVFREGSSFAAPLVSGTLAMLRSLSPQITRDRAEMFLLAQTTPHASDTWCRNNPGNCGRGMLDMQRSVHFANSALRFQATFGYWPY